MTPSPICSTENNLQRLALSSRGVFGRLMPGDCCKALLSALLLSVLVSLSACGNTYSTLVKEDSVPSLAEPKAALEQTKLTRRSEPVLVETGPTNEGSVRIAVHQAGVQRDEVIVFIHGMFTDSSSWRFLAGDLSRDNDLLLVDLPGCGLSDKPSPRALGEDGYGPNALARRVLIALRDELGPSVRPDQPRIVLAGHSYGSGIILRMFGDEALRTEFGDLLARVSRVVLISGMDFAVGQPNPDFVRMQDISGFEVALARLTGVLDEAVASSVKESFRDPNYFLKEEADLRREIIKDPQRRAALQGMLTDAVPFIRKSRGRLGLDWDRVEQYDVDYAKVNVPTLILWGSRDEILPTSMGYKLDALIPNSKLIVFVGGMHSIHMEKAGACAAHIREFISAR
jgi:pimeloyl-ACP methyl ester carboxylesterase